MNAVSGFNLILPTDVGVTAAVEQGETIQSEGQLSGSDWGQNWRVVGGARPEYGWLDLVRRSSREACNATKWVNSVVSLKQRRPRAVYIEADPEIPSSSLSSSCCSLILWMEENIP